MKVFRIEVAVETPEDAVTAQVAKADRVELSAALDLGGLTPSLGLYEEVRAAVKIPVWVMLRPRPGDFVYSDAEFRAMCRDADHLADHNPDGIVFGILRADGTVDAERCAKLRERAGNAPAVFHRAFDRCPHPEQAMEALVKLGFVRILTSGREPTALAGSPAISTLRKLAKERIELLPCGRVRASSAENVLRISGCDQVHGSFAEELPPSDDLGRRGYPMRTRVSFEDLNETRAIVDRFARGELV